MEKAVYKEENGVYQIDCSAAVWSTDQIYNLYHTAGVFLKDADFVIETPEYILLVEYKNADIPGAVNPQAFKPFEEKRTIGVARKFYESLHYLAMEKKDKPVKYIYIVEYPHACATVLRRNCPSGCSRGERQSSLRTLRSCQLRSGTVTRTIGHIP